MKYPTRRGRYDAHRRRSFARGAHQRELPAEAGEGGGPALVTLCRQSWLAESETAMKIKDGVKMIVKRGPES